MQLHISPCPNDTFIFHAMLHSLVDTEGVEFEVAFEDIDALNKRAQSHGGEIMKISYATLPLVESGYRLLSSGGALGFGNAPLVVGRNSEVDLTSCSIAIPGFQTTAALLLKKLIAPDPARLRSYIFSDIARAVCQGEVDAGVLIHEGRFTYHEHGLSLIADLGELWDAKYALPVPLGAIVIDRQIENWQAIERTIRRSAEYALSHPEESAEFVRSHARELSEEVCQKHINYFVNQFSIDLGEQGRKAVQTLINIEL